MRDARQILAIIDHGAKSFPEKTSLIEIRGDYLAETVRGQKANGKPGRLILRVDDDFVKAVRGPESLAKWHLFLVAVPAEAVERAESRIVLPGEVKT